MACGVFKHIPVAAFRKSWTPTDGRRANFFLEEMRYKEGREEVRMAVLEVGREGRTKGIERCR